MIDTGHKIVSPQTYTCNLCQMTYGLFKEKKEWKDYRKSSQDEMEFLHKDEFEKKYNQKRNYPLVMCEKDGELNELISPKDLSKLSTIEELIKLVEERKNN